jgi:purine-binding chemotaxis protein CheW
MPQAAALDTSVVTEQAPDVATELPCQSEAPTVSPVSHPHVGAADPVDAKQETAARAGDGGDWIDGRPSWAQNRFDVLLFSVSQLNLAVPLVALGQIQKITEELTPLFGQSDWFMGLLPTAHGKVRCVDTALFVMRERYRPEFRDAYQFVITINGLPWGLAVDGVNQPISLEPEEVNWRGSRSQRPWLAGTVKEHMCALLDIPKLGEVLAQQDKSSADKK